MFIRENNKSKILELPYHKFILDISGENSNYYNIRLVNNENTVLCHFYDKIDKIENFIENHVQKISKSLVDIEEKMNNVIEKLSKCKVVSKIPKNCRAFRSIEYNGATLIAYTHMAYKYKANDKDTYVILYKNNNKRSIYEVNKELVDEVKEINDIYNYNIYPFIEEIITC